MFILLEAVGGVGRPVNHGEPASRERAAPGRCAPLSGWAIMRIFCDVVSGADDRLDRAGERSMLQIRDSAPPGAGPAYILRTIYPSITGCMDCGRASGRAWDFALGYQTWHQTAPSGWPSPRGASVPDSP